MQLAPIRPFGTDDDSFLSSLVTHVDIESATDMLKNVGFLLMNSYDQDYEYMRSQDGMLESLTVTINDDRLVLFWKCDNGWEFDDDVSGWMQWMWFVMMLKRGCPRVEKSVWKKHGQK